MTCVPGPGARQTSRPPSAMVDSAGQLAKGLQRLVRVVLEVGLLRVLVDQPLGEAQPDLERDQLLLRPVVNVALEPAAGLVLGAYQSLAGMAQVLEPGQQGGRQPRVAEHQSSLSGKGCDPLGVGGRGGPVPL